MKCTAPGSRLNYVLEAKGSAASYQCLQSHFVVCSPNGFPEKAVKCIIRESKQSARPMLQTAHM